MKVKHNCTKDSQFEFKSLEPDVIKCLNCGRLWIEVGE